MLPRHWLGVTAEIGGANGSVTPQFIGLAAEHDMACFQHIAVVGDRSPMRAFCSTSKTVVVRRISEMIRNTACTITGAKPNEGSSRKRSRGRENPVLFKDTRRE